MRTLIVPASKIDFVQSAECGQWVLEHCARGVQGRVGSNGAYALTFVDDDEADAFQAEWLA
ncbi:hypothetical protein [Allosphingosinicella deserti]|uniref:Uncharacterized protein n=1 Tax=Allosphingosinicella deserti TaxID=2116704 RepID=A0A2P7QW14_9SPHN|nr:hypothetical protein [Sphingomonas deserti]PSJ42146.1 hypothetical protein C7I55_07890 [Sphingomonas deserti]